MKKPFLFILIIIACLAAFGFVGGDPIRLPNPYNTGIVVTGVFPDIDAAESVTLNITGLPGDNVKTTLIRIYPDDGVNDPGADFNINCLLTFYNSDSMTEDEKIDSFYFNMTYSEVKTGTWASGATGGDMDSTAGLLAGGWLRMMGGTAETENIASITDADTIVITATGGAHVVDEGLGREVRITTPVKSTDFDGSRELHLRIEFLVDPGDAFGVAIAVTVEEEI